MNVTDEAREMLTRCVRCEEVECDSLVCETCLTDLRGIADRAARRPWKQNTPYLVERLL